MDYWRKVGKNKTSQPNHTVHETSSIPSPVPSIHTTETNVFNTKTQEILDNVTAMGSLSVFRVSTGSRIEAPQSQSPASTVTINSSEIWDAPTQPIPVYHNPISRIITDKWKHLESLKIMMIGKNIQLLN